MKLYEIRLNLKKINVYLAKIEQFIQLQKLIIHFFLHSFNVKLIQYTSKVKFSNPEKEFLLRFNKKMPKIRRVSLIKN